MKETAPTFSVVNGKVMRATSTARAELRPVECAAILNELLTALREVTDMLPANVEPEDKPRLVRAYAVIAKATGG